MTAILAADVFPGLDKHNPLNTKELEEMPERFGKNWYQHESGNQTIKAVKLEKLEQLESDLAEMKS